MLFVELLLLLLLCNVDTLFTELAAPIGDLTAAYCSLSVDTLLAEPKLVLAPALALDGATLNGNVVKLVFDTLRMGGGGGLMFGGRGGATVGRLIGGLGACLVVVELIASCDWNICGGPRIVPKCWVDGNTGPPGSDMGGDLRAYEISGH